MARKAIKSGTPLEAVKKAVSEQVNKTSEMKLEYFELADSKNLTILNDVDNSVSSILCIAGYAGEIRLIDNMFLDWCLLKLDHLKSR